MFFLCAVVLIYSSLNTYKFYSLTSSIEISDMLGSGQGKNIWRSSGGGRGLGSSNCAFYELYNETDVVEDVIGSNNSSPIPEEFLDADLSHRPSNDLDKQACT